MSAADVEAFLAAPKAVSDDRRLSWRKRSEHVRVARTRIEAGGVEVGEVIVIVNLAHRRHWSFKLLLHGAEVRRWDLRPPGPRRHRNPPECPADFPRRDQSLEHEHVWHEGLGVDCSRPLQGAVAADHADAYARFCTAANIDPKASYTPPPSPGEQLQL